MKTSIEIKRLKVDTVIGICDWEQYAEQPLIFDAKIRLQDCQAHFTDHIDDALDYAAIAEDIQTLVKASQARLLESLLWEIAQALFGKYEPVQKLKLRVRKPQAIAAADSAIVSLSLDREAYQRAIG